MKCRRVQPLLLDFSFGRLEAGAAGAVAVHLEQCADCRRVLKREQYTATALGGMTRVEPRMDAWPAVEAAIRAAVPPVRARSVWFHPLVWAGGLAATAALAVGLIVPTLRPPATLEPDPLRALAPTVAAGLSPDRADDPLMKVQSKLDRLLDRVADERS